MSEKIRGINVDELKTACNIVEKAMRLIGKDCEIITMDDGVQLALLSWSGCGVEKDLFEALFVALKESEENY